MAITDSGIVPSHAQDVPRFGFLNFTSLAGNALTQVARNITKPVFWGGVSVTIGSQLVEQASGVRLGWFCQKPVRLDIPPEQDPKCCLADQETNTLVDKSPRCFAIANQNGATVSYETPDGARHSFQLPPHTLPMGIMPADAKIFLPPEQETYVLQGPPITNIPTPTDIPYPHPEVCSPRHNQEPVDTRRLQLLAIGSALVVGGFVILGTSGTISTACATVKNTASRLWTSASNAYSSACEALSEAFNEEEPIYPDRELHVANNDTQTFMTPMGAMTADQSDAPDDDDGQSSGEDYTDFDKQVAQAFIKMKESTESIRKRKE